MEIKSLAGVGFDVIFKAFAQAFADYEMQVDRTQLQVMLKRRGFLPELSFAAFEGDDIVAFTLNGVGLFNGVLTAYDTGTGTVKAYRKQGLATQIFQYSVPYLREMHIQQYLLEVLQHNTKAVSIYTNQGFEVSREFNYFMQRNDAVLCESKQTENFYSISPISVEALATIPYLGDFHPSWQNSMESIARTASDFTFLGAFVGTGLVGYCVFDPISGDVTQIAVDQSYRRKGIASLLLAEMRRLNKSENIKVLNTAISCESITAFLQAKNIPVKGQQFEMIKKIAVSSE